MSGAGNSVEYRVVGIAAFILLGYDNQAVDNLMGRFVEYYAVPSIGANYGGPPCDPEADGCDVGQVTFMGLSR